VAATAQSLYLDVVTEEVVTALRESRVRSILLRGPAIERWLYDENDPRSYVDIDLLASESGAARAEEVLSGLGFSEVGPEGVLARDRPPHARRWYRARDTATLDLHRTVLGATAAPAQVWRVLSGETVAGSVGSARVEILREPALALLLALHAAHHGAHVRPPLEDLERALRRAPDDVWSSAELLAASLDATPAFATGLRLVPGGELVASRLGLPADVPVDVALRASTPPPMAFGFEWLAGTPGLRAKAALVVSKAAPSPAFMRAWSRLARRGLFGLIVAYLWRPLWLLGHAGPGLLAWLRARRQARST